MSDRDSFAPPSPSALAQDAQVLIDWAVATFANNRARAMAAAVMLLSKLAEHTPGGRAFTRELDLVWMTYAREQFEGSSTQKRGAC